jgi:hypothetical protein
LHKTKIAACAAIFVGITGEIMQSLQSFECTLCIKLSLPAAHFPAQSRAAGWAETRGWWRVKKSSGYDRKLSFFHTSRILPWSCSFSSVNRVTSQFATGTGKDFTTNRIFHQERLLLK